MSNRSFDSEDGMRDESFEFDTEKRVNDSFDQIPATPPQQLNLSPSRTSPSSQIHRIPRGDLGSDPGGSMRTLTQSSPGKTAPTDDGTMIWGTKVNYHEKIKFMVY
jgi:hypothetical protein